MSKAKIAICSDVFCDSSFNSGLPIAKAVWLAQ